MTNFTPIAGMAGGILIGLSAIVLMAAYGRIAGLSGIFGGLLTLRLDLEFSWRIIFILGLLTGTALIVLLGLFDPSSLAFSGGPALTVAGGVMVGAGTAIGGGCTSGHGICGLSRLSVRSMVATSTFLGVGVATVFVMRYMIGV